ncbi:MAG: fibronectin type III domain-containing protein [Bacteroidales bacterium]|jgi:subtilisin-like proprotein convertase family protein
MKKTLLFLVTCLFTIQGWSQCNPPTNLVASNITQTSLTLSWTAGDTSQNLWEIEYSVGYDSTFTYPGTVSSITNNVYLITGLTPQTSYCFRVRTICPNEVYSDWSNPVCIAVPGYSDQCLAPFNNYVNNIISTSANLSFTPAYSYDSVWLLKYKTNYDANWTSLELRTNSYSFNDLQPNTVYLYEIYTKCSDNVYSSSYVNSSFRTSPVYINILNNNKTFNICGDYIYDDGGEIGDHGSFYNYKTTLCPTDNGNHRKRISVRFDEFSLGSGDYMMVYSGRNINPNNILSINGGSNFTSTSLEGKTLMSKVNDTTGCITINVITNPTGASTGFKGYIDCVERCQIPVAALDTFYVKIDALGVRTNRNFRYIYDSVYSPENGSWIVNNYKGVDFCEGDSIVLVANPQFPENGVSYPQFMNQCIYRWSFGDGTNANTYYSNSMVGHKYNDVNIYNVNLTVVDTNLRYMFGEGCESKNSINTRVRFASNPIKSLSQMPNICSGHPFLLDAGYDSAYTLVLDTVGLRTRPIARFDSTSYIPDGPNCANASDIQMPITINQFAPNSLITSPNDILSCCINIEHSFLGDLSIYLICPNGQTAALKSFPGGNSLYLGLPYGGNDHNSYDFTNPCTNPPNLPGKGFNYCFSNVRTNALSPTLTNCPSITANDPSVLATNCTTCDSTNRNDASNYYRPDNDFSSLIGCPKNGEWKIQVMDQWGIDNGFIFSWDLEFDTTGTTGYVYQVPIDSVIWTGPFTQFQNSTTSLLTPPFDSIGVYNYNINVIDNYGCIWDATTSFNVLQSPYAPTNLDINISPNYLELTWQGDASTYEVYRDDSLIARVYQPIYMDPNVDITINYCYKVKAIGAECESEFSERLCSLIGLEDVNNNDLSVTLYPNPTTDKTILKVDGLKNNADVIVYDLQGRAIKTYKMNASQKNLEIDVESFAKGIYNIKLVNSDCNITKKLIVR